MPRKVILAPNQAASLMAEALQTVAPSRLAEKGLNALISKLLVALDAKVATDGNVQFKMPEADLVLELEDIEIFGAKTALVQATNGFGDPARGGRPRQNEGYRRFTAGAIASALGVLKVYKLETRAPGEGDEEKVQIEYDDAPKTKESDKAQG